MTLTTEQLKTRIEALRNSAIGIVSTFSADAYALEELLRYREAQPVAWEMRYWNSGHNCWHDWERITAEQHAEMSVKFATDNDYEFRVLYDAPPAPKSANAADWGINMQTGTPILVYKNCSVIESEQAHYVLSLINNAASAPAVPDKKTFEQVAEEVADDIGGYSIRDCIVAALWWNACRAAMLAQPVSSSYRLNSPVIPDGWKLVPVEPTEEMLRAAYRESGVYSAKAYRAMLAAAPEGGNG
ncbi:hypothetical protein [Serratia marcescens]|uniref:hypothetical protein n=1 Tax=Serratia marcescens TaxID=615 RepID=UPI0007451C95|nr:hypothetical protein [Serratia marcescens]MBN3904753.1 hypothetical protein [Serratia marcescens]MBN3916302.1 hypothetical protein [Serratia marcescens]MBN3921331.1 hypothetical protein [Serratia marcescens]MBN3938046.1 hypothetical protein [Serratia marcescens]MBN3957046.1 hypothetical protein [Serratia marcescens]